MHAPQPPPRRAEPWRVIWDKAEQHNAATASPTNVSPMRVLDATTPAVAAAAAAAAAASTANTDAVSPPKRGAQERDEAGGEHEADGGDRVHRRRRDDALPPHVARWGSVDRVIDVCTDAALVSPRGIRGHRVVKAPRRRCRQVAASK